MFNGRLSVALLLIASLVACGDDGGPRLIDSGIGNTDAGPKVCTALSSAGMDVTGETLGTYIGFYSEVTEMIGGLEVEVYMDFYHSVIPNLAGTFDLSQGAQASYADCGICIYAASFTADGTLDKFFFQKEGSVTFTEDPITGRKLNMQITGLKLAEATIDQSTGDQTFLPLGDCTTLAGTLETDNIPNAWTCDTTGNPTTWYSGATGNCDCNCGAYDPDCRLVGATVNGCSTAGQACWPDPTTDTTCVTPPLNDTCATNGSVTPTVLTVNNGATAGTTIGATRNYTQPTASMGNTCTKYRQSGPDVVYKVQLTAGTAYTITLANTAPDEADFDPSLTVIGPDADNNAAECTESISTCAIGTDEGVEDEGEAVTLTPGAGLGGTYYIIVDTYYVDSGNTFTIAVTSP